MDKKHIGRDERIIRENGGAELFDGPQFAPYCRLVGGKLAIREAQALDYREAGIRDTSAATYHLIAMILIRTAGNFLENWTAAGHPLNLHAYSVASHLYNRAAFAMRQTWLAELYANAHKNYPRER